jgi:hypothetical protein
MVKLLLLTLGTWSVVSVFLVGTLGFLIHFREQRARATGGGIGAKFRGERGRTTTSRACSSDAKTYKPPIQFLCFPRNPLSSPIVERLGMARTQRATEAPCRGIRRRG